MATEDERFVDAEEPAPEGETWEQKRTRKVQEIISSVPDEAKQIDEIAKVRGWFSPNEDSSALPLVQDYLAGKLDLQEVVSKLAGPAEKALAEDDDDLPYMDLYNSVIHSAKRLQYNGESKGFQDLVELVRGLKSKLSSLQGFGMAAREATNDSPGGGSGYSVPETHAYANMEYFYALLTRSGVFDLWIYAIWAMRAALEEELTDDGPNDAHEPGTKVQKYDGLVPGAAMWVLGLGEELYEKEEDLTPSAPNQGKPGRPGKLWTDGKAEFSEARWKFWKKRFGEVMEIEGTRKETVDIAKQAYELMQKIDGEGA